MISIAYDASDIWKGIMKCGKMTKSELIAPCTDITSDLEKLKTELENEVKQRTFDLGERVKELRCAADLKLMSMKTFLNL